MNDVVCLFCVPWKSKLNWNQFVFAHLCDNATIYSMHCNVIESIKMLAGDPLGPFRELQGTAQMD